MAIVLWGILTQQLASWIKLIMRQNMFVVEATSFFSCYVRTQISWSKKRLCYQKLYLIHICILFVINIKKKCFNPKYQKSDHLIGNWYYFIFFDIVQRIWNGLREYIYYCFHAIDKPLAFQSFHSWVTFVCDCYITIESQLRGFFFVLWKKTNILKFIFHYFWFFFLIHP